MSIVEINDLTAFGQINDIPAYQLPPEAWTFVENMRYRKDGVQVMEGWTQVFGTPSTPPHFAIPVRSNTQTYWLYVSLTKAWLFDGVGHFNITRVTDGDYNAQDTRSWNGIVFGGIPILNNGTDVPQYWSTYNPAVPLAALPNWPSSQSAAIIRGFGSFLVAYNITDTGVRYPHLVQWSNQADPGTVPTSWNYADATVEAGRKDLPDVNAGGIQEALQLQDTMFIYKEQSMWKQDYIGGQFIFSWKKFADVGILGPRCVCVDHTGLRHIVATQDDIVQHNGNTIESILTDRQRITLFSSINLVHAENSFIFLNRAKDEIWFCYPEQGQTYPTRALVWNYRKGKGAISFASGITFRNAVLGDIEGTPAEAWDVGTDLWSQDTGVWGQTFKQKLLVLSPDNVKFYQFDMGLTRDGVNYIPVVRREDLGIIGRKRSGEPINDWKQMKMVDSVWPKIDGSTPVKIRVGFREHPTSSSPLVWQDYTSFDPTTDDWVNTIVNEAVTGCGRAVSVEFTAVDSQTWRLDGYSMNVTPMGMY